MNARILAGWLLVAAVLAYVPLSFAATSLATSTADWSSLSIVHMGGGSVVFDPASHGTLLNVSTAVAGANSNEHTSLIWDEGSFASASDANGDNTANALAFTPAPAGNRFIDKNLYSRSSVSVPSPGSMSANASDLRSGRFTVTGAGPVVFTLNYDLFLSAMGNVPGASANGSASIMVKVTNLTDTSAAPFVRSRLLETLFDGTSFLDGNRARVNPISAGLIFSDGDRGLFEVSLSSFATATVVPIPASGWLLGLALVTLFRKPRALAIR